MRRFARVGKDASVPQATHLPQHFESPIYTLKFYVVKAFLFQWVNAC